jgi:hypothetical protein
MQLNYDCSRPTALTPQSATRRPCTGNNPLCVFACPNTAQRRAHGWYAKEVLPKSTHIVHPFDRTMEIPPRSDITFNLPKVKSTRLQATETLIVDLKIASQGQTHRPNLRRGSAAPRTFASAPSFTTASSTEASHKPQRQSWSSLATVRYPACGVHTLRVPLPQPVIHNGKVDRDESQATERIMVS